MEEMMGILKSILSGGIFANILKAVLAIGLLIALIYLKDWLKKQAVIATKKKHQEKQEEIANENEDISKESNQAENEINEIRKNLKSK